MPIEARLTLNPDDYDAALEDMVKKTAQQTSQMSKSAEKVGSSVQVSARKISTSSKITEKDLKNIQEAIEGIPKDVVVTVRTQQKDIPEYSFKGGGKNISVSNSQNNAADFFNNLKREFYGYVGLNNIVQTLKSCITTLDNLGKASRNIGISASELQELEYAARSANMEMTKIPMAFSKIKQISGKALVGDKTAVSNLRAIGLEVDDLKSKKPYELFELISSAIMLIQDPIERSRVGIALFGEEFDKMTDFLVTWKESVKDAKTEGLIIDDEQIKHAERFNQSLETMTTKLKAIVGNSKVLKNLADWVDEIHAYTANPARMEQAQVYDRRSAVDEAIRRAEKSGRYTAEEIKEMKNLQFSYSPEYQERYGYNWDGFHLIDKAMNEAGFNELARNKEEKFDPSVTFMTRRESLDERTARVEAERKKRQEEADKKEKAERLRQEEKLNRELAAEDLKLQKAGLIKTMYANPGSADKKQLYEWELKINAVKSHEDLQKLGQEMDNVWSKAKNFREIDQESKFDKLLAKSSTVREKLGGSAELDAFEKRLKDLKANVKISVDDKQFAAFEKQLTDLEARSKFIRDETDEYKYQELKLAGKDREAEKLKLHSDLKKNNAWMSDADAAHVAEQRLKITDAQKSKDWRTDNRDKLRDLQLKQLEKTDKTEAEFQRAKLDAKKKLGRDLTGGESDLLRRMTTLSSGLSEGAPKAANLKIETNELTARGGFQGGALVPPKENYNKDIRTYNEKQTRLLEDLKTLIQKFTEE